MKNKSTYTNKAVIRNQEVNGGPDIIENYFTVKVHIDSSRCKIQVPVKYNKVNMEIR